MEQPVDTLDELRRKAQALPSLPGIYVFKGRHGDVLYVGKSVSLRQRVSSYLQRGAVLGPRIRRMISRAVELEFFVTDTEEEALIAEFEFINTHRPRFNVVFRDDKSYPYLKVTVEEFPRILYTRRPNEHAGEILGPFPSAKSLRRTLRFLSTIFPVRSCKVPSKKLHTLRACLDFHIKRCQAPCEGKIDAATYQKAVADAVLFLKGKNDQLLEDLRGRMREAADQWDFEKAARIKQKIDSIESIHAKQEVSSGRDEDFDVFAVVSDDQHVIIQQMSLAGGRIASQRKAQLSAQKGTASELLGEFLKQHYLGTGRIAPEILISEPIPDQELLERVLSQKAERKVEIRVPSRGRKAGLVQLAMKNASFYRSIQESAGLEGTSAIKELAEALVLPEPPKVIECFDISHLGGTETVASMVVAREGQMDRSSYRRFRIRKVEGIDDFACMREVVTRRYRRLLAEGKPLPDLVLLDGGLGQLSSGREALLALGLEDQPIAALAKREEILYAQGFLDGLVLPEGSQAHRMVRRIRDEAHRFAITYHRKLRSRRTLTSELEEIRGVGPKIRKRLLEHFRDVKTIRMADRDELQRVPGISTQLARKIHDHFHPEGDSRTSPADGETSGPDGSSIPPVSNGSH